MSAEPTPANVMAATHGMAYQIRGTAGYNLGGAGPGHLGSASNAYPGAATSDPSPLDTIREQTNKLEDLLDTVADPIKPYLPAVGRFLIVVTFLEDALRIITQWSDQLTYLRDYRHIYWGVAHLFLVANVIVMISCSTLVIARKHSEKAVAGLLGVVVSQALGYGLIFDLNFFLRNLSVIGGLLMVLSDSWVRKRFVPAGLPQLDERDRKMYIQFAGRVLLIFLFAGFIFAGDWTFWRVLVSFFGFIACVMVVVGFKAKFSAIMLVVILSVFNLFVNNWSVNKLAMLNGTIFLPSL
ncbi:hypothetical protein KEM52_003535 [Ascosphaera acerosa]|nr:hypothetical protein KEM52_003535 [Ascosphaera acerosa]